MADINDAALTHGAPAGEAMLFCPATGEGLPSPDNAKQWRAVNPMTAWLYHPWTGERRSAIAVGSDPFGYQLKRDQLGCNRIAPPSEIPTPCRSGTGSPLHVMPSPPAPTQRG